MQVLLQRLKVCKNDYYLTIPEHLTGFLMTSWVMGHMYSKGMSSCSVL